jgi:hypothetical protein
MRTKTSKISNSDDIIDSRDVIARIEELREEIEAAEIPANEVGGPNDAMKDEREELAMLESLADDAEGCCDDWKDGATLIHDSYFKHYAMALAEDIGAVNTAASWPNTCIDWDQAAKELKMDYTSIEFGDVTYWVR